MELPKSILSKSQTKIFGPVTYEQNDLTYRIIAKVSYDDQCGNGHNTFAITGEIDLSKHGIWVNDGGGCLHKEIAKHFPELKPLIKWHLCNSDGPSGYIANTVYAAGERDCWGLLKGEFRQHTSRGGQNNGVAGIPSWKLQFPENTERDVYANEKPAPVVLEWQASGMTGKGKERELESARYHAVWPEATDEDLTAPGLEERLQARLPALMAEFKQAVKSLGFVY